MAKKSLYLFLTSLLGVFLFFTIHRVVVFLFLYFLAGGYLQTSLTYYQFLALDFYSLFFTVCLGVWYGIWLGRYWYEMVYVQKSHGGLAHHLATKMPPHHRSYRSEDEKNSAVQSRLVSGLEKLEKYSIIKTIKPRQFKRTLVRKKAPKRLTSISSSKKKET